MRQIYQHENVERGSFFYFDVGGTAGISREAGFKYRPACSWCPAG